MPSDIHKTAIHVDKTPAEEHALRFNALTTDEVANIMKYRLMIRENEDNHILKCHQLFQQYNVDMYAKIETERFIFIRLNQIKLRSEEYTHLRDSVINHSKTTKVGRLTILPFSYAGSPRHLHEYAQDAIADTTARTAIENRRANYHVAKYQPGKILQPHAACSKKNMSNVVEATILAETFKGEDVLIPRILMIPTDLRFQFKRLQFAIQSPFAFIINEARGQSLELCGLDLDTECFSHGQLYVACCRTGKPDNLYI
ncbi:unnamed protein product [Onchocerca ochengi]|uniref:Helitron_like_N domain-containing protein n=1 Tax=Onchocerca ochengi TaxID=42157 RepID=A0A182E8Q8_ONCOC|nr:unnamed protein product [Onchocerca ochengi]